jgi:hypothetical protein
MKPVLVKVDVAVADTGRSVHTLYGMADGGTNTNEGLRWVFDFSKPGAGQRRDLRFWRPEVEARGNGDVRRSQEYRAWDFEAGIRRILPETHPAYRACEVSDLFQIRGNTRINLLGVVGQVGHRASYARRTLVDFLRQRWLGRRLGKPARKGTRGGSCLTVLKAGKFQTNKNKNKNKTIEG